VQQSNQSNLGNATNATGTAGSTSVNNPQQQANVNALDDSLQALRQADLLSEIEFGQATGRGLSVTSVGPASAFFASGLRPGDVIVEFNGQPIRTQDELVRMIGLQPGERVPMTVLRSGRQETIYYTSAQTGIDDNNGTIDRQMDRPMPYQANRPISADSGPAFLGVGFDTTFGAAAVRDVVSGSAAEQAGLQEGDVIVGLNGQAVSSAGQAMQLIRSMQAGEPLEIEYTRRVADRTQATLGARPTSRPGSTTYPTGEEMRFYRGVPQDVPPALDSAPPRNGELNGREQFLPPQRESSEMYDNANSLP
jgi:S1-C subfamily serine protease